MLDPAGIPFQHVLLELLDGNRVEPCARFVDDGDPAASGRGRGVGTDRYSDAVRALSLLGLLDRKPVPVLDQHFGSVLVAVETAVEQNIEGEALGGYVLVNFLCERDRAFLALRERDGFGQASGTDRQHGGAAAGIRIGFGRHRDGGRAGSSALGRYAAPLPGRRGGDFGTPCRVGGESDRFRSSAGRKCLLRSAGKRQFGSRSVVLLVASGQPCGGKG